MSFKSFPIFRLEELIGSTTLKKIASILPAFDSSLDTDNIYTKNNLVKVIYSFFDSNDFSKTELRREFLLYQNEVKINEFCTSNNISKNLSFDNKVDKIMELMSERIEVNEAGYDEINEKWTEQTEGEDE